MSGISSTLVLPEVLRKANISEEDFDYYLNHFYPINDTFVLGNEELPRYCGSTIKTIRESFRVAHGYLSLIICIVGSIMNLLNIIVLGQRELSRAPINRILRSLAVADLLLMVEYIPFSCHMYLSPREPRKDFYSYGWAVFVLFHAHFTQVAHTVSIWLTLTLAFWRFDALRHERRRDTRGGSDARCRRAIILAYVGSVLLCVPSFITFGIEQEMIQESPNSPNMVAIYMVNLNLIATTNDAFLHKLHLWTYSVVMKLAPCLVLTLLTCWLIRRLWEADRHHQRIQAAAINSTKLLPEPVKPKATGVKASPLSIQANEQQCQSTQESASTRVEVIVTEPSSGSNRPSTVAKKEPESPTDYENSSPVVLQTLTNRSSRRRKEQTDRTTRMLVAVVILFLTTEVPQGVLGLLSVVFELEFFTFCYTGLGEILDILALLNSAINFVLYCSMSRQFRTHFARLISQLRRGFHDPRHHHPLQRNATSVATTKTTGLSPKMTGL